jgi:glycerol uptake facilitator-like aquaporin
MNALLVEFLGTMFFVFIIFATDNILAIGAAITISIYLGGGKLCAFNPAVAIVFYAAGKLNKKNLILYIIVDILGALAGFYLWKQIKK